MSYVLVLLYRKTALSDHTLKVVIKVVHLILVNVELGNKEKVTVLFCSLR